MDLYPVTVISSRYGGCYEGAEWVAFNKYPWDIQDAMSDDITCAYFFDNYPEPIGRGDTPQEAVDSLNFLVQERKEKGGTLDRSAQ